MEKKNYFQQFVCFFSLIYVTAPCVIFLLGYVRNIISIPIVFFIIFLIIKQLRLSSKYSFFEINTKRSGFYILLFLISAIAAICSGIGGFTLQDGDYYKHNAFFKDLIELDWPLAYQETGLDNKPRVLNAYLGYYLPSALIGKIFGLNAGIFFSLFWGALGLFLAIFWFLMIIGKGRLWLVFLFIFFGGIDIVGYLLVNGRWPNFGISTNFANWMHPLATTTALNGLFWIFPSNLGMLANGPHHVLPSWVILLIIMYDFIYLKSCSRLLFLWGLASYISVFFFLGMTPYVVYFLFHSFLYHKSSSRFFTFENTLAFPLILGISLLYLLSNNGSFEKGFIWEYQNIFLIWQYLVLFYLTSIGIYLFFWPIKIKDKNFVDFRPWLIISVLCIIFFPIYKIGQNSDFPIKSFLPSVMVFLVCFSKSLILSFDSQSGERLFLSRQSSIVVAIFGAISGLYVVLWGLYYFDTGKSYDFLSNTLRINEIEPKAGVMQLFSDGKTFFWKSLAKNIKYNNLLSIEEKQKYFFDDEKTALHISFLNGKISSKGYNTKKEYFLTGRDFSIELLVRPKNTQVPWALIFGNLNEKNDKGFSIQQYGKENNKFYFGVYLDNGVFISTPALLEYNQLNYVCYVYSNHKFYTYLDGNLKSINEISLFSPKNSSSSLMVRNNLNGTQLFNGEIFELKLSDAAISFEEIERTNKKILLTSQNVD